NNETVADISALQQAILKGTDLNALEETAAGGPQAGGNGGDGVSLSSTSFAEGGHISNINANVGSIDALSLAAGGDNSFGVSGGSAVGAGAGTGATTPKVGINISSAGSNEGGVMTYDLSLPTTLTARPTTLNLNFSGGVAGKDYDANSIEYSTDGGSTWTRGTIVNLTDANQINSVKVRVKTIDNYGLDGVDLAHNPTAMGANQNQGEQDGSKYSNLNGVEYGVYKRNLTLNVTTDNDEIAKSQANGKITDNDDYVNINQGLNGDNIATEDGEDTLNMNTGAYANSRINLGAGDDALNIKGGTFSKVGIDLGSGNNTVTIEGSFGDADNNSFNNTYITNWQSGNDTVTIKSGATVKNAEIGVHNGEDIVTLEKDATLEHSRVIMGDGNDKLNINGTVTRESHINLDNGEDTLNVSEGAKISDSDIQTDDSGNGYKDTVNIANKVTLENWADIQAGGGNDEITAGDNLTLSNHSGIHGDWGNNGSAGTGSDDGDDIIKVGKNLTMSGGSIISGGGGKDEITIGENANISGNSTIDGGAGNDKISMTNGTKITDSKILMGNGENTLNITRDSSKEGSDITLDSAIIQGGADKDIVNISNTTKGSVADPKVKLENDTSINLGDGDNEVTVDGSVLLGKIENGTPTKKIIMTGSGKDNITLQNGAGIEERVIETGEGADQVNVYDGAYLNFAKIETGKGDDVVRFEHLTRNPLQGYSYSAATDTKINMGDGDDSLLLTGMGNSGNYTGENRRPDFQLVKIDMGDNGIKRVQINGGNVEATDIKTGSGNDLVQIQDDSLMEGRNSIYTGAGEDKVEIRGSKLNGTTATVKTDINTGADTDRVVINNSTLTHAVVDTDKGDDFVDIEEGTTLNYSTINTSEGKDTITINRDPSDARITFQSSALNTGDGVDTVEVTNTTFLKLANGNYSAIDTGDGDDKITINGGTIFQDASYIVAGTGADKIYLNSGSTFNFSRVYGDYADGNINGGNDEIYVNGAVFNANGHGGIYGGGGNDKIFVNSGTFNDANIEGGAGNDTIVIGKGNNMSSTTINGGAGKDTLVVNDDSTINFSKVSGIEKIQLGGHADENGNIINDNATLSLT
ncbi:beta strand repeat-containing protein, partial [Campylobacter concisus]|uniref:beta strand repeat-containing protein n=1 Tax=Campylobacter concisus TaxID=199 RepID=UPI00165FA23A